MASLTDIMASDSKEITSVNEVGQLGPQCSRRIISLQMYSVPGHGQAGSKLYIQDIEASPIFWPRHERWPNNSVELLSIGIISYPSTPYLVGITI